ncbi:hypothetical protein Tco_1509753 [Tanacetum coccineum]
MHNNIMAAGSRDRPPMLATGRYAQWRSRFLRYIDTRPNGDALRKCILTGPYIPTMVTTPAVPATEDSPEIPAKTSVETVLNMTPENKAHYESEKEAIHLILTGIGDEIYSTVGFMDSSRNAEAIERYNKIAKPITHPSESASEEDSDPEQAQKDKEMQKNLALITDNQRTVWNQRVSKCCLGLGKLRRSSSATIWIQCFTAREFGLYSKECRKPKRVKTHTYHKKRCCCVNNWGGGERCSTSKQSNSDWLATRMRKLTNKSWKHITVTWQRFKSFLLQIHCTDTEPLDRITRIYRRTLVNQLVNINDVQRVVLLPPKKQIHSQSSSSTTLSNSSWNQTCDLSPYFSVHTPTPPQIFKIRKSSIKIHLKHHEEQIKDILNYLEELSFLRIGEMEEDNKLKTELKKIRTQINQTSKKAVRAKG